jgi:hypothetical protein
MQVDEPVLPPKVPAAQFVQAVEAAPEYIPVAQLVHMEDEVAPLVFK